MTSALYPPMGAFFVRGRNLLFWTLSGAYATPLIQFIRWICLSCPTRLDKPLDWKINESTEFKVKMFLDQGLSISKYDRFVVAVIFLLDYSTYIDNRRKLFFFKIENWMDNSSNTFRINLDFWVFTMATTTTSTTTTTTNSKNKAFLVYNLIMLRKQICK